MSSIDNRSTLKLGHEVYNHASKIIQENGEVFIVIEYGITSKNPREYALISSLEQLKKVVDSFRGTPPVHIFDKSPLTLKGVADKAFLQQTLAILSPPEDYLLINIGENEAIQGQFFEGDMDWELEGIFDDFQGQKVAFGIFPRAFESTHSSVGENPLTEVKIGLRRIGKDEIEIDQSYVVDQPGAMTKLGGDPNWIQSDETPVCDTCGVLTEFIVQVDSIEMTAHKPKVEEYMFGDSGMIYTFFCYDCLEPYSVFQCY